MIDRLVWKERKKKYNKIQQHPAKTYTKYKYNCRPQMQ